jgi:hypothetical protein
MSIKVIVTAKKTAKKTTGTTRLVDSACNWMLD